MAIKNEINIQETNIDHKEENAQWQQKITRETEDVILNFLSENPYYQGHSKDWAKESWRL